MNLKTILTKKKINSLYVHIPFCKVICPYCDFIKFVALDKFVKPYLVELNKDIDLLKAENHKFKTIYIGGGTPSILSLSELEILLKNLQELLDEEYEFTIEVNPESLDENKLKLFKKYGINRISIGIQTFNTTILKTIKRDYKVDIFSLINMVKKYISNINVDFIYGFEGQTIDDIKNDLDNFIKLDVDHISIYSLIIEQGSEFYAKGLREIDQDKQREFYDFVLNYLRKFGYERYEISNFARNKMYSKHNLNYWKNEEYIGIGVGASGYVYPNRYKNSLNLTKYLKGEREIEAESTENVLETYYLITNLRLAEGFSLLEYKKLFNKDFYETHKDYVNNLISNNLATIKNGNFACTDDGLIILDMILTNLI